jgi:AAHS family 4-hydroxybenzoate transporter-like MFS transporter
VIPQPIALDVDRILDEGRWSPYQKVVVALAALTIVFDGFDIQLLGFAVPALLTEWNLTRPQFAPVLALGLVGMTIGTAIGGMVGDRIGRRKSLIGAVTAFGAFTLAAALADGLWMLGALRFLAGLGLGAAMPNATALASEYVPVTHRPLAVTLTIVCIPIGGVVAGVVAAAVLPSLGWRALFAVGGFLPLAAAIVLWGALPESPRFLAERPACWPELTQLLRRFGREISAETRYLQRARDASDVRIPLRAVYAPSRLWDTCAIAAAFFFCLLAVYSAFNWLPAMLTSAGFGSALASSGLTAFNLGGVVGAIAGALLIQRFGSRAAMTSLSAGAILGALALLTTPLGPAANTVVLIVLLTVTGGFINAVQTTSYALAAHLYPTSMRSSGVGNALAIGRVGAILSSFIGAWVLGLGGGPALFVLMAASMTVNLLALAVIRQHISATA